MDDSRRQQIRNPEWQVIINLLKVTDSKLLNRLSRKLLNLLYQKGVPEIGELIDRFNTVLAELKLDEASGQNKPNPKLDLDELEHVLDETFAIAAKTLEPKVISQNLMQWIREDRTKFLTQAAEKIGIPLVEITDTMGRYFKLPETERELSEAQSIGVKVGLIRRFLKNDLHFINIAKNELSLDDFGDLLTRVIGPAQGTGRLGGKGAGLFLAHSIIHNAKKMYPELLSNVKTPRTWYLLSDGIYDFILFNALDEVLNLKYNSIDEVKYQYQYFEQVFKHSEFSTEIVNGLSLALDDLADKPIIVRSSSLLEDSFGAAFSGKYKSLFIANLGLKKHRFDQLGDAISEVYASTLNPDAIQYRTERGLLDYREEMGCLIQQVVGKKVGKYFLPSFAGVAFSNNEFRWSPRIKRDDGIIRLVAGLGTRAVDRVGNDYPLLVSPGQPGLRANVIPEEIARYSQKYIDCIDLETSEFKTLEIDKLVRDHGDEYPGLTRLLSKYEHGNVMPINPVSFDPKDPELIFTFENLLSRTPFLKQMKLIIDILAKTLKTPVDVEFASDGTDLYILQCRPQAHNVIGESVEIPDNIAERDKVFSANRYVSDGVCDNIRYLVYVDPVEYDKLPTQTEMMEVGKIIGRLNLALAKRRFVLMGPGRWGSRGDIKMGVRVTYSDINNTAALIEVAKKKGNYTPELSFGTHFFQDLVEANISYLPLYPDEKGVIFNNDFIQNSTNSLVTFISTAENYTNVVKVIDIPRNTGGKWLRIVMNGARDRALAWLHEDTEKLDDYSFEAPKD